MFKTDPDTGKQIRGFAAMSPERRSEVARKGGASTAPALRAFSVNRELAREAGRKGGVARAGNASSVEA